jgi:hypothetical protein
MRNMLMVTTTKRKTPSTVKVLNLEEIVASIQTFKVQKVLDDLLNHSDVRATLLEAPKGTRRFVGS